ncbi:MAG: aminopeptidase P N-terminal domain-containing protein [Chitinophagales bacterium]|nr:aminopeptidase P N-terminal domain-containing protein [Chitinophagales bacterium]MDW8419159.1 aminopeptidase P N-terminal domain-containing protein [Chitinophagales bacterium]
MRYDKIDSRLFTENRRNFRKQMKKRSLAVFISNEAPTRSADATYKWRQNPDLFYLTGIDQEQTSLILFPDAPDEKFREVLFIRRTNEHTLWWEGRKHSVEEAKEISGCEQVMWHDRFPEVLRNLMHYADHVYLNTNEHDRSVLTHLTPEAEFARNLMEKFPLHRYERSAPIMHRLRASKSDVEIALMKRAIAITHKGFLRAMKFLKPDVWEYEVEAEITHEYMMNRATGQAYEPIIASGVNACVLHYIANNSQCRKGELLLMDCGAEYANYNADLTRVIPVSGRFTARQRKIYDAVLRVLRKTAAMMRPGVTLQEINNEAAKIMESELIGLKLLTKTDLKNQTDENPAYRKYFPHGIAHFLGLDVHDVGNRYEKLRPGAVLTCEPGIYIREEKTGIRLENNILVTKNGPVDLTADIPIEAEEIEEIMNSK